jgi:hypothetical protein
VIVLKHELPIFRAVSQDCVHSGDGDIFGDAHIHVLLAADVNLLFIAESNELEDLALLSSSFSHYFQHNVRLFRFRNVDRVELLVIQVNAVLVVCLAHLAKKRLPVNSNAKVVHHCLNLLG